ncbi:MAG: hypothetical protein JXR70_01830 [Spirochaetales bacterium]|nr:hypothetical protein [Spirochaetales bacterium]
MAQDERKKQGGFLKGIQGFFKAVTNTIQQDDVAEESQSFLQQEDKTQEILLSLSSEINPSQSLFAGPLNFLHDNAARQAYFNFIAQQEGEVISSLEQEEIQRANENFNFHRQAKEKEISAFLEATPPRDWTALGSSALKRNIPPHILGRLLELILEKAQNNDIPEDAAQQIKQAESKIQWQLKSEEAVISYLIKALNKKNSALEKGELLEKIRPHVTGKITHEDLKQRTEEVFSNWIKIYKSLEKRKRLAENDDFNFDSFDFDAELPEFGEKEENFLKDLSKEDKPDKMARQLEEEDENRKNLLINNMAFDPRFDKYFDQMVQHLSKDDLGTLMGIISSHIRQIEQKQGFDASEEYLEDIISRVKKRLGPNTLIENKILNIKLYLQKAHQEYTRQLAELKKRLDGLNIQEQIGILRTMGKDPQFQNIFGTVQNMERLLIEEHFEEIFNGLPVKTQEIVAKSLLSDLNSLKNQYPYLIDKLKRKLELVSAIAEKQQASVPEVDYGLLNKIVGFAREKSYDIPHEDLDDLSKSKKNREEILNLLHEIDRLPSLDERIITVKFWLDNAVYEAKPHLEEFLKIHLSTLKEAKAREGGLLRMIFDHLKELESKQEKLEYLNEKLKDPVYAHMHPILNNLIANIQKEEAQEPDVITEHWIREQIDSIEDLNSRINWIKIRMYLPSFAGFQNLLRQILEESEEARESAFTEDLEDTLIAQASVKSLQDKKGQGSEDKIHKNIISLTREIMSIPGKVERRKFIKEQETLYPLDEEHIFYKQRKLLYYLVNVDNDDKPGQKLKVLADKVLYHFKEKAEFFKILKLSRFSHQGKSLSMMDELKISDSDLAYYAAYIVGSDKTPLEVRLNFLKNFSKGDVRVEEVIIPKGDIQTKMDYKDFFQITPAILDKAIKDLSRYIKEKPKRALDNEEINPDTPMAAADEKPFMAKEENFRKEKPRKNDKQTATETSRIEQDKQPEKDNPRQAENDLTHHHVEVDQDLIETEVHQALHDTDNDYHTDKTMTETEEENNARFHQDEKIAHQRVDNETLASNQDKPSPWREENDAYLPEEDALDKSPGENKNSNPIDDKKRLTDQDHASSGYQPNQREKSEKPEEKANTKAKTQEQKNQEYYEKNKTEIDKAVTSHLENLGKERSKALIGPMTEQTQQASKQKENRGRIWAVMNNLKACYPEAVPDLIEQSIIPVFTEAGDTLSQDIFTAMNQNIFKPILFQGADVNVEDSLDAIENFMGKKDVLTQSRPLILEMAGKMKNTRFDEIKSKVSHNQSRKSAENEPVTEDNLLSILTALSRLASPQEAAVKLQQDFIPRCQKSDKKELHDNLVRVKGIIGADKRVNWPAVEKYFGPEITGMLKNIKSLSASNMTGEKKGTEKASIAAGTQKFSGVESYLTNMAFFEDPHKIIRSALEAQKDLEPLLGSGKQKERQDLIDQLYDNKQIFTFDKRFYIGHGRLADFIHDKNNQGYDKPNLAKGLLSFLSGLETNEKAAFVGVEPEQWPDFEELMEQWSSGKKLGQDKKENRRPPRTAGGVLSSGAGSKKKGDSSSGLSLFSGASSSSKGSKNKHASKSTPRSSRSPSSKPNKTPHPKKQGKAKKPVLTSKSKEILDRANKIITEKLVFLIKQYDTRKDLKMLEQSYLRGKSENLKMLIDPVMHSVLYSILEKDEELCQNLSFDQRKITSLFSKMMKKLKK